MNVSLSSLSDETLVDLFRYACEADNHVAADALEAEITERGIYGRKRETGEMKDEP